MIVCTGCKFGFLHVTDWIPGRGNRNTRIMCGDLIIRKFMPICVCWHSMASLEASQDAVSNHRRLDCLLNRWFRCTSKKTSKLCVKVLCEENPSVTGKFPSQILRAVFTEENKKHQLETGDHFVSALICWWSRPQCSNRENVSARITPIHSTISQAGHQIPHEVILVDVNCSHKGQLPQGGATVHIWNFATFLVSGYACLVTFWLYKHSLFGRTRSLCICYEVCRVYSGV